MKLLENIAKTLRPIWERAKRIIFITLFSAAMTLFNFILVNISNKSFLQQNTLIYFVIGHFFTFFIAVSRYSTFQMVNFFAVFCSLFIMLEISNWMQHTKQFIKLSCEVMVFLLCETVIWLRIIVVFKVFSSETHSSNDADATENISNSLLGTVIRLWLYYVFLFGPVVNLLTHLLLIHHIIRKARIIFFTSTYAYNVSFY